MYKSKGESLFKKNGRKKAESTYLAWIDCSNMSFTMEALQEILVQERIMNGQIYGNGNYLRMNCGAPLSKVQEGMSRLLKAFRILRDLENIDEKINLKVEEIKLFQNDY
jgi:bifunctional pyridoxal-dependent enzyme with beta-cystathionase and maltose regulon repressor activities